MPGAWDDRVHRTHNNKANTYRRHTFKTSLLFIPTRTYSTVEATAQAVIQDALADIPDISVKGTRYEEKFL
jgi:hypothetical protein